MGIESGNQVSEYRSNEYILSSSEKGSDEELCSRVMTHMFKGSVQGIQYILANNDKDDVLKMLKEYRDDDQDNILYAARTPLVLKYSFEILDLGSLVSVTNDRDNNYTHVICTKNSKIIQDTIGCYEYLISKIGKEEVLRLANLPTKTGNAGYIAAMHENWKLLEFLTDLGVNVVDDTSDDGDSKASIGFTPIHKACKSGAPVSTIEKLVSAGANVNHKKGDGWTPFHLAVWNQKWDIVPTLVNLRADLSLPIPIEEEDDESSDGGLLDVLRKAFEGSQKDSEGVTSSNPRFLGSDTTILHSAAARGAPTNVLNLLATPEFLESTNKDGMTPLYVAAVTQQWDTAISLLTLGANPHVKPLDSCADCAGWNLLHLGARYGSGSFVEKLRGVVDPNTKKKDGFTPLHLACLNGHLDVINKLLSFPDIDVLATNNKSKTPLVLLSKYIERETSETKKQKARQFIPKLSSRKVDTIVGPTSKVSIIMKVGALLAQAGYNEDTINKVANLLENQQ